MPDKQNTPRKEAYFICVKSDSKGKIASYLPLYHK